MGKSLFFLLFVALFSAAPAFAEPTMAITSQASGLDDFLSKPELVEKYFAALQEKYGKDRFHREGFDKILAQLRDIKEKVPALKERLWEAGTGEAFSVETLPKTYGRNVDSGKWVQYYTTLKADVATQASSYLSMKPDAAELKAAETIAKFGKVIGDFRNEKLKGQTLTAEGQAEVQKVFQEVKENPELRAAFAYFLHKKLENEKVRDNLLSGEANRILDTMQSLRKDPYRYLPQNGRTKEIASFARGLVPDMQTLLEQKDIFSEVTPGSKIQKTTYHFKPVSRVLDGIWKGIAIGECVGGNCHGTAAISLTPERWLSSALEGTALYDVEEHSDGNTRNRGFIEVVPLRNKKTAQTYGSIDFGASVLTETVLLSDPETGTRTETTLLQKWLTEAPEHLPENVRRMAVGESKSVNNAGVLDQVHPSLGYATGPSAGHSDDFETLGTLAKQIVDHSPPREGFAKNYSGRMIIDGLVPGAGQLRVVNTEATAQSQLRNMDYLSLVFGSTDASLKMRWMAALQGRGLITPEMERIPEIKATLSQKKGLDLAQREQALLVDLERTRNTLQQFRNRKLELTHMKFSAVAMLSTITLGVGVIYLPEFRGILMQMAAFSAAMQGVLAFVKPARGGTGNQTYLQSEATQNLTRIERELASVREQIKSEKAAGCYRGLAKK